MAVKVELQMEQTMKRFDLTIIFQVSSSNRSITYNVTFPGDAAVTHCTVPPAAVYIRIRKAMDRLHIMRSCTRA
jgi:hypothetical protein